MKNESNFHFRALVMQSDKQDSSAQLKDFQVQINNFSFRQ